MRLADLNDKTVVIVVNLEKDARVLRGLARYEQHPELGWVLRVALDDAESKHACPILLLPESTWSGEIHECEYCILLRHKDAEVT
jgi:hypothetical protein